VDKLTSKTCRRIGKEWRLKGALLYYEKAVSKKMKDE